MATEVREEPCRTALNRVYGMMFRWTLNPYTGCAHRCTFCYVRAFERRADRPSDDGYGRSIRVKTNVAEALAAELARPSWRGERIVVGAATDPYQPIEARYRLTRRCLHVLAAARNPFELITRGPMVVRDVDVLSEASRRASVNVNVSIPTLDPEIWRRTEPGTASPRERLRAVADLRRSGVRCGVALAPILPGLTDRPEGLDAVVRAAREAGAAFVWAGWLYLKPGTREYFLESVRRHWPELTPLYDRLYGSAAYLRGRPVRWLERRVRRLRSDYGFEVRRSAETDAAGQLELPLGEEGNRVSAARRASIDRRARGARLATPLARRRSSFHSARS